MDESADSTFTRIEFTRIRRAKRGFDDEICDVNSDQDDVFDVPTKKIRLNKDRSRIKPSFSLKRRDEDNMMECNQVEKEVEADISAKMKDVLLDPIEAVDENAYESSEENDSQGDSNDENYVGNDYPDDLDDDALADDNDSVPDDYYDHYGDDDEVYHRSIPRSDDEASS